MQAVLGVLSGLKGPCFFQTCYQVLGEMLDLLALFNGAVNFLLYCAMSRQFRATFCSLFLPRWAPVEAAPPPGTTAMQAPMPSEVNSTVVWGEISRFTRVTKDWVVGAAADWAPAAAPTTPKNEKFCSLYFVFSIKVCGVLEILQFGLFALMRLVYKSKTQVDFFITIIVYF
jgi:hypothetical protein